MAESNTWIVTAKRDVPVRELAAELEKLGFEVRSVLEEIGSIVGTIDSKHVARIRRVAGVADVIEDADVSIGPPGEGRTW